MMGYRLVEDRKDTIGLHMSYTTPLNCDFDGDENNLFNIQGSQAIAEVRILMNVVENIMSWEQNKPIMGLIMNTCTGAYKMSNPGIIISYNLRKVLYGMLLNDDYTKSLTGRLSKYNVLPESGPGVLSMLFPPDFNYNFRDVLILEGVLVKGNLTKKHVGASELSIIHLLHKKYGSIVTARFFTESTYIIGKWIQETGFTVGWKDMIYEKIDEDGNIIDLTKESIKRELADMRVKLESLESDSKLICDIEYKESRAKRYVNVAESSGGRLAREVLAKNNSIGIMSSEKSGANLVSDQSFNDFKLHIEFKYPKGSNSGVYLRGRYEVQIADNAGLDPSSILFGGIYGFLTPTENMAKAAGVWQSYDITLIGRRVSIVANGKPIIIDQAIPGITGGALDSNEGEAGPFLIQGDHGPVEYRNIIVTPRVD